MCPEYNTNLDMLDVDECQGTSTECPDVTYWSNDVYLCKLIYCFLFLYFTMTLNLVNYNNDQYFTYRCNLSTENKPDTGFQQHNTSRHSNNNVGIEFSSVEIRCILSNAFISSSNTYTRKMLV